MTPEEEVLGRGVDIPARLVVPYMVTGSIATSYHGRPRATHYSGVVMDPTPEQLEAMLQKLETAGFCVDPERAREALQRRQALLLGFGQVVDVVTAEDAILSKLDGLSGDSERQMRDAAGVLELNPAIDRTYVKAGPANSA